MGETEDTKEDYSETYCTFLILKFDYNKTFDKFSKKIRIR